MPKPLAPARRKTSSTPTTLARKNGEALRQFYLGKLTLDREIQNTLDDYAGLASDSDEPEITGPTLRRVKGSSALRARQAALEIAPLVGDKLSLASEMIANVGEEGSKDQSVTQVLASVYQTINRIEKEREITNDETTIANIFKTPPQWSRIFRNADHDYGIDYQAENTRRRSQVLSPTSSPMTEQPISPSRSNASSY